LAKPIWLFGFPSDLGTIQGDRDARVRFTVYNPHLRAVELESAPQGCGSSGDNETIPPLLWTEVTVYLDATRLPVGPGVRQIAIRGLVGGEPFERVVNVHFTVQRPEVQNAQK